MLIGIGYNICVLAEWIRFNDHYRSYFTLLTFLQATLPIAYIMVTHFRIFRRMSANQQFFEEGADPHTTAQHKSEVVRFHLTTHMSALDSVKLDTSKSMKKAAY